MATKGTLDDYLETRRARVEEALERLLDDAEPEVPPTLLRAMRYALFPGGKRLRPVLALAACEACGEDAALALPAACAIELIHGYSLVHDDLPAMDDDDLRRGKPSTHKAFGEAMAILAGDALLTRAFAVLVEPAGDDGDACARRLAVVAEIAAAAGAAGMIGGQVLDLEATGASLALAQLEHLHRLKTGRLLRAALVAGALAAGASETQRDALARYGDRVGLAFQVVDDVLDVDAASAELGKTAGKDERDRKATYPALLGLAASRRLAHELSEAAVAELASFGPAADPLRALARRLVERRS